MKKKVFLENFPAYFAYLFSGLAFFSLPTSSESFVGTLISYLLVLAVVFSALEALFLLKKQADELPCGRAEKLFDFIPPLFCASLFSFFTKSFAKELPLISKEFDGGRFSHFFVILSLILALYIGKRGFSSYSGVCIVILPLFVLPNLLTCFNFLEFGGIKELENARFFSVSFETTMFADAFLLCAGVTGLFSMQNKNSCENRRKGLFWAFLIFSAVIILEGAKYLMWFGAKNLAFINRPDRVMLAQVPFMNVQELFLFSYYTAYVLKISVFAASARAFVSKTFAKIPEWASFAAVAAVFYLFYLFLPFSYSKISAVISFFGLYLYSFGIYTSRIILKKCRSSKISRQQPKKSK